jgi:arylsulfatase A-like enzyme
METRKLSQLLRTAFAFLIASVLILSTGYAAAQSVQQSLPPLPAPFKGEIGLSYKDSKPDFPKQVAAPKGAPNILLVLLDDVGYGASSTFGGPINTPTLERLAKNGLKYTNFHTTALCSPTRAALITGRNHHSVHTGVIIEAATGYPGYDSLVGKDTATIAEALKQDGWNTAWFGKQHNVPDWQSSDAGPFDLWPTGLGFEYFYGFIGGDTNQWRPNLYEGTKPVEPYIGNPDYNLDYDLADQAIKYLHHHYAVAPDKPFFVYYAPGAAHAPHHPRKEWVDKYKSKFDQGWDQVRIETLARQKQLGIFPESAALTVRSAGIPTWDGLSADQKRLYERMMEIYAGYLSQTDYNVGRVVDAIQDLGQLDNTLVIYIVGDNGASAEGSLQGMSNEMTFFNGIPEDLKQTLASIDDLGTWKSYNHYPVGWAHAMNAPFQWAKQIASHYGGTANALVISWPAKIKDVGQMRTQWHHVIDIVPTIYEAAGMPAPSSVNGVDQRPIEGVSMVYTFDHKDAPSTRRTQYFEMLGNRGIYHDGWIAATTPPTPPWSPSAADVDPIAGYKWELYDVTKDPTEAHDLAANNADKLQQMQLLFYAEASKYNVLPIDNSKTTRMGPGIRPSLLEGRTSFIYYDGDTRIPEGSSPETKNRSFSIKADVEIPAKGADGMIVTQGGLFGGWALYLEKGKPTFFYNTVNIYHYNIASPQALAPGKHTLVMDFKYDGGGMGKSGTATLSADGKEIAQGKIERTVPVRYALDEGLDVGEDTGTPVNLTYDVPFKFTGKINKVTIDLKPMDAATARENKKRQGEVAVAKGMQD